MDNLVEARCLVKSYNGLRALNDFNFTVERGRIVGLLGPNGSGKTTFIKILSGLLTSDSGFVLINGKTPGFETKSMVSYLPERPYFNSWMRVDECLDYFEDFYEDFDRFVAERMLADLGVPIDAKLKTLSKGRFQKPAIAGAFFEQGFERFGKTPAEGALGAGNLGRACRRLQLGPFAVFGAGFDQFTVHTDPPLEKQKPTANVTLLSALFGVTRVYCISAQFCSSCERRCSCG